MEQEEGMSANNSARTSSEKGTFTGLCYLVLVPQIHPIASAKSTEIIMRRTASMRGTLLHFTFTSAQEATQHEGLANTRACTDLVRPWSTLGRVCFVFKACA